MMLYNQDFGTLCHRKRERKDENKRPMEIKVYVHDSNEICERVQCKQINKKMQTHTVSVMRPAVN